jgi:hypothetical protein
MQPRVEIMQQVFILDICWLHPNEQELGFLGLYEALEPIDEDLHSLA